MMMWMILVQLSALSSKADDTLCEKEKLQTELKYAKKRINEELPALMEQVLDT